MLFLGELGFASTAHVNQQSDVGIGNGVGSRSVYPDFPGDAKSQRTEWLRDVRDLMKEGRSAMQQLAAADHVGVSHGSGLSEGALAKSGEVVGWPAGSPRTLELGPLASGAQSRAARSVAARDEPKGAATEPEAATENTPAVIGAEPPAAKGAGARDAAAANIGLGHARIAPTSEEAKPSAATGAGATRTTPAHEAAESSAAIGADATRTTPAQKEAEPSAATGTDAKTGVDAGAGTLGWLLLRAAGLYAAVALARWVAVTALSWLGRRLDAAMAAERNAAEERLHAANRAAAEERAAAHAWGAAAEERRCAAAAEERRRGAAAERAADAERAAADERAAAAAAATASRRAARLARAIQRVARLDVAGQARAAADARAALGTSGLVWMSTAPDGAPLLATYPGPWERSLEALGAVREWQVADGPRELRVLLPHAAAGLVARGATAVWRGAVACWRVRKDGAVATFAVLQGTEAERQLRAAGMLLLPASQVAAARATQGGDTAPTQTAGSATAAGRPSPPAHATQGGGAAPARGGGAALEQTPGCAAATAQPLPQRRARGRRGRRLERARSSETSSPSEGGGGQSPHD